MQKWEYLYVRVSENKVLMINNQKEGKFGLITGSVKGEPVHEFLNRMGQDGWEVIALTHDAALVFILKRPI